MDILNIAEKLASTLVDTNYTIEQAAQYCNIPLEQLTKEVEEALDKLVYPCVECGKWHELGYPYIYPERDKELFDSFDYEDDDDDYDDDEEYW